MKPSTHFDEKTLLPHIWEEKTLPNLAEEIPCICRTWLPVIEATGSVWLIVCPMDPQAMLP